MSFPEHITTGFNFDEAIEMADLSRRVYKVFDESTAKDPQQLYNALYDDEWQYIHGISDHETDGRCMILKRKGRYQFAIVFRGSVMTNSGLELTNLAAGMEDEMIEYKALPYEKDAPPRDARVHKGYWSTFSGLRDELELFFEILVGSKLEQSLLVGLVESDHVETASRIAALGAALKVKYGDEIQERIVQILNNVVQQLKNGEVGISSVSLDALVSKEVKYRKVLENLVGQTGEEDAERKTKLEVYIAGHSMGGALATLAILTLKRYFTSQNDFPPFLLKKYTIGSPKTGNKLFVEYYNAQLNGYSHRVQNLVDLVPYGPTSPVPREHYLTLMLPNIDHVRSGDNYYAFYQHVGEAYNLVGTGHQTFDLDFGGALKFSIPMPFPHGPDGYIAMLQDARQQQERLLRPFQGIIQMLMGSQESKMDAIQKQLSDIQKRLQVAERNTHSSTVK
ncbi:MAG: hypothetical protein U0175_10900 [Caldilineaceae bacterium]